METQWVRHSQVKLITSRVIACLLFSFSFFFFCNGSEILVQVGWEEDVGDAEREKSCLRRRLAQP